MRSSPGRARTKIGCSQLGRAEIQRIFRIFNVPIEHVAAPLAFFVEHTERGNSLTELASTPAGMSSFVPTGRIIVAGDEPGYDLWREVMPRGREPILFLGAPDGANICNKFSYQDPR